jgi:hypothetical protein
MEVTQMPGILVIAPDRDRWNLLKTLLHDHAQVESKIVESVQRAIADFEEYQPDVIVTPPLLPTIDSDTLFSHVKHHAEPHVQILSLPALDLLCEPPAEEERERFTFFRRGRRARPELQYDPSLVGSQIAETLERARQMRDQQPPDRVRVALTPNQHDGHPDPPTASAARGCERRQDRRFPGSWIVQLPGGADADLVNISRRGILIESRSLVSPGVTLKLNLGAPGKDRFVLARFVRSDIARTDRLGVRYHAAARFESPFEIPGLR